MRPAIPARLGNCCRATMGALICRWAGAQGSIWQTGSVRAAA